MKATPLAPILDAELMDAIALAIAPVELGAQERDRMRARILKRASAVPPSQMTTLRSNEGAWERFAPGIHTKTLSMEKAANMRSFLLRMDPGSRVPVHSHTQQEECLVIEGEVHIGDHIIRSGDWHVALPGTTHDDFRTVTGCLLFIRAEMPSHA